MFELFKYLHILTMFAAVSAAMIPEVGLHFAGRQGNVANLRGIASVAGPIGKSIPIIFLLGLAFGLVAVFTGGFDPFRPWLLASYVVFAIAMGVGGAVSAPWAARVGAAAESSPLDQPSSELRAAIEEPRGRISSAALISAIVVIVFLMVIKPGG